MPITHYQCKTCKLPVPYGEACKRHTPEAVDLSWVPRKRRGKTPRDGQLGFPFQGSSGPFETR